MGINRTTTVSAPAKVHLLGEHAVVYGKPALLAALDLRVSVTISKGIFPQNNELKPAIKTLEEIVKDKFKLKSIPSYNVSINTKVPLGSGLGSSAALSASFIAALLSFLKIKWDLSLVNDLAYEAEKVFHGNPSGADNSTVVFGGLIWYKRSLPSNEVRKEIPELKLIQQAPFSIPSKIAKNFVLINTGKPKQTTKDMVTMVKNTYDKKPDLVNKFLEDQEKLVRELLVVLKIGQGKEIIRIIKEGEKNLESIGVSSKFAQNIIRKIEQAGGAAKICGGGACDGPTGVLLCYHPNPSVIKNIAKAFNLDYFKTELGVEGLRKE